MKRYIYGILGMVCAASLCGCGVTVPDLTEEQTVLVTEYATNLLVKHSAVSNRSLLEDEELEAGILEEEAEEIRQQKAEEIANTLLNGESNSEKKEKDESAADVNEQVADSSFESSTSGGSNETAIPSLRMAEFFAENNFSIDYMSYTLCDSYPENADIISVDAPAGKQLCVLKFRVKNLSSSQQPLDMFVKQADFSLQIDNGAAVSAESTLLMDDLASYAGTLQGDSEEQMVLLFEVSDGISQIGSMQLHMSTASGKNVLTLP